MASTFTRLALTSAMVLLASCGGGESSSGGNPVVVAPTPTPVPTPTPTPTQVEYQMVDGFARSFTFGSNLGFALDLFVNNEGQVIVLGASLLPVDQTTSVNFVATPETAEFTTAGVASMFTGSERTTAGSQYFYRRPNEELILGLEAGRTAKYVTKAGLRTFTGSDTLNGVAGRRARLSYGLIGPATASTDQVPSMLEYRGAAVYFAGNSPTEVNAGSDQNSSFIVSQDTDDVRGVVAVRETVSGEVRFTSLLVTGKFVKATGVVEGTLANQQNDFTGTFRGRLFGPQGRELGLVFAAKRGENGLSVGGEFVGTR